MPMTMVGPDGVLWNPKQLRKDLTKIKECGAAGVMTDVWWGITEPYPREYNFEGYKDFCDICKDLELEVQIVASFHQCGEEGWDFYIPLPSFVRDTPGLWFKNALGDETRAYISLFADDVKIHDRTPMEMYEDWIHAFAKEFSHELGSLIVEVMVGLGTDGELKYPSYTNPAAEFRYPGIGMFQASDEHALESLKLAAKKHGHATWGQPPSVEATGDYNSFPNDTLFFQDNGLYQTPYGRFFLSWYSKALIDHGSRKLAMARSALGCCNRNVRLSGKIAGVHWWYKTASHPAELTAGYYNTNGMNAYAEIAEAFSKIHHAAMDFTCLEMTDSSHWARCGPQELVKQAMSAARQAGIAFTGENAVGFYDATGYGQILSHKPPVGYLDSVTYLRMCDAFLQPSNLRLFAQFVAQMSERRFVTPFSIF
mmetsp:Transcript_63216/g.112380  ORF Transcript_63216/g.112380 Transcript_63216/m.112380 type:complete len:425 (+) Transcript_63216:2-1276(+)